MRQCIVGLWGITPGEGWRHTPITNTIVFPQTLQPLSNAVISSHAIQLPLDYDITPVLVARI